MRSDVVKKGPLRTPHKSLLKATGLTDGGIDRPLTGVVTSQSDIVPGHINLDKMIEAVKKGVLLSGGTPLVFPTIGVCNGIAVGHEGMKYSLVARELIVDTTECTIKAHGFDALVLVPNCDKIVPGMMMTALRLDIPSIIANRRPILTGKSKGREVSLSTMFEAVGAYEGGTMLEGGLCELENKAYPTHESCLGMSTANSMSRLTEVLGLVLPSNGTIPTVCSERIRLVRYAGMRAMGLLEKNIKPGDIVNKRSIKNALTVDMALGYSTDSILHLTAIVNEAGVEMNLDIINEIPSGTPNLCKLAPASDTHVEDSYWAGGIQVVIMEFSKKNLLELEYVTTTPETHKENLKGVVVNDSNVIRSVENPYSTTGGIQVLKGNPAEDGVVVKKSVVLEKMLTHKGPARVLDPGGEMVEATFSKKIIKGDVVVIRYGGSKGGPRMGEMPPPTSTVAGMGLDKYVALITDGRFSGVTKGAAIRHASPEAAEGGNVALVEEGDTISIDIPSGELELLVDEEVLARRRRDLRILEPKVKEGYLTRYAKLVSSTSKGAISE